MKPSKSFWQLVVLFLSAPIALAATNILVWPSPPDPARIAFTQCIQQPADAGARQSGVRRFANWFSGAAVGNEKLSKPFGIAVDDQGGLCLTDTGLNTVAWLDPSSKRWRQWDRVGDIRFSAPVAVAKNGSVLFVADSALGAVIAFGIDGKLRFRIDHDLERPSGLAIVGDRLWVTDVQRHCLVAFDLKGKFRSRFGKRGVGPGEFNFPTHAAADRDGRLYVTDSMNNRVQVFDSNGTFQAQIGSAGDASGYFGRPKGVAVDSFGHVYIADAAFDTIQIFDRTGAFLLSLGGSGSAPGEFWMPNGIAIDRENRIYVSDAYNRRVQVLRYVGGQ